jgi:SpoVK/Ycf46/Vps4 family AAA+-type ATPase
MADLRVLDFRLHRAVERVRATIVEGTDPGNRGLLIEESDVDGWLQNVDAVSGGMPGEMAGGGWNAAQKVGHPGGRLYALAYLFGLSPLERAAILTALAPEVELDYANLFAYVQDDVTKKHPTLDLVAGLWCDSVGERLEARRLMGPEGLLRRNVLMQLDDSPGLQTPLLSRPLLLDPRIAAFLLGSDEPDNTLSGSVKLVRPDPTRTQEGAEDTKVQALAQLALALLSTQSQDGSPKQRRGLTVWMRGAENQGKRLTAERMASYLGVSLLVVDTPVLVTGGGNLRTGLLRALREARLQGAIIYWSGADVLMQRKEEGGTDLTLDLTRALSDWLGCSIFDLKTVFPPHIPSGPVTLELDYPAPSNEERRRLWDEALGDPSRLGADVNLPLLIGAFRLTGEQIAAAADTARQSAAWRAVSNGQDEPQVTMRDLLQACRAHSNQSLGMLARKITPRYTWADLVLPGDRHSQLREMCSHIRFGPQVFEEWGFERKLARGKGLNVLFAGQPGTGKTMAAEVLATDLGLELYKIDLSSVVSKYIGETEKNLEKIFHEGQTSNAILFFDEADSLFGKRSEVKDSHDRYANLEISYLLQRMEEYDGIVILATNLRKNMDDAFVRRMHGAIEFPMPEELDRLEIWRRTFPEEAPVADDLDLEFLARKFKLSGGNIKNIVLEAAFFAAESGTKISMAHLVKATRREHQKIGRLFHESDFGPYAYMVKGEDAVSD